MSGGKLSTRIQSRILSARIGRERREACIMQAFDQAFASRKIDRRLAPHTLNHRTALLGGETKIIIVSATLRQRESVSDPKTGGTELFQHQYIVSAPIHCFSTQ
jgi:hypothetical protein